MTEREQLEQAIAAMETQRAELGDAVVDAALNAFHEKLASLAADAASGEQRPVTVLFAELVGFTELAAERDLEEVREIAGQLWARLDSILARAGGLIDKHAGDVVMAIFGASAPETLASAPDTLASAPETLASAPETLASAPDTLAWAGEDDPERAVRAALEMLAETQRFVAKRRAGRQGAAAGYSAAARYGTAAEYGGAASPAADGQGLEQVRLRAGINSGPALLSAVGSTREYTALGDTVNLASRLQSAAQPGEVLVSETTVSRIRGIFNIQTLDPIQVKGKAHPVPVYRVRGVRARAFRVSQHLLGSAPALIGRDAQLASLDAAFKDALASRALRVLTLLGEAGIGKTRLVHEYLRRMDRSEQPFILFRGRPGCGPNSAPYALVRDLLSFRFKIMESDSPAAAREKLVRGVESWLGPEGVEAAHWIGHLAGFDFSDSAYLVGRLDDPRHARQAAFQALNRFLFAIAAHTPLLILVDDLQRADDGSLDWLESLMRAEPRPARKTHTGSLSRRATGPVLVLCVAQPDLLARRPGWQKNGASHTTMPLNPLSLEDAARLARILLHAMTGRLQPDGSVAWLVEQIASHAGGSPLCVEQMAQALLDAGVLQSSEHQGGGAGATSPWRVSAKAMANFRFPDRLDEVLRLRLEALTPAERQALEYAAVIGPAFWESALQVLLDGPDAAHPHPAVPGDLNQLLHNLQSRGLILRREVSAFEHSDEYRFTNALLWQAAYDGMPGDPRRAAHARVAGWLAAQSGERVGLYTGAIAWHFERAGDALQAAGWYTLAAQQASRASDPEAAARYYRRALELLPHDGDAFARRVQIYKGLWDVQWWQARFADALVTGEALLEEAEARQDQAAQAAAWNRVAAVLNRLGDQQAALRSVQHAERLARAAEDSSEVVLALFNRGLTLYRLGDASAALAAGEQALAYNQALLGQTASVEAAAGGQPATALSGETSQHASEREGSRILNLLAMIHQRAGRFALADADYRQVLALCRIQNDAPGMIAAYNNLGVTACQLGDYRASAGYYQEALHLVEKHNSADLRIVCLNNLAGTLAELGEYDQAEAALKEILGRVQESGTAQNDRMMAEVYRALALACLGLERREEALAAGQHALELALRRNLREHQGRTWRVLGRIAAAGAAPLIDDRPCDARACYAASLQCFVELGECAEQARTARDWARYELARGDPREGARLWQEAIDLFTRLGLQIEVERMNQMRGDVG